MSESAPKTNRAAWADEVRAMLELVGDNKSELARRLSVSTKTVDRWLEESVDVSEEKVRVAARVFERSTGQLLVKVGYYAESEVGAVESAARSYPDLDREAIDLVESSGLPAEVRAELLEELRRMAKTDAERRKTLIDTALRLRHV